jgi:hypothetical protein
MSHPPAAAGQHAAHGQPPSDAPIDLRERGAQRDGQPQLMDRRLFMQLLVLRCPADPGASACIEQLGSSLRAAAMGAVLYEDVNDPLGIGVLSFSEEPADFITKVRPAIAALRGAELRPDFTMLGRSYSSGFEPDLEFWLLRRPRETVLNEAWQSYAAADHAHDVRLACHGLDANDNEFVIGLIGKSLHPLSHVVQAMRSTRQTAEFIEQMGPFFVGRAVLRSTG